MNAQAKISDVFLCVDRDGLTNGIQISIERQDTGYRLAGPKYNGSSKSLVRHRLTERDIEELLKTISAPQFPTPSAA